MGRIRKLAMLLALCMVLCALPVTSVGAAESGSLWLRHLPTDGGVTMALVADTGIGSGVITITYDPAELTFQELSVDSAYVLAHAINDKEAGTIKISWVGSGANSEAFVLMRLQFAGNPLAVAELSGNVVSASGDDVDITVLDFGAHNAAWNQAAELNAEDYTADSFSSVQAAMESAEALWAVETVTQAQLDAATQALVTAMENLVVYVPEPEPTDPPATEPAPTEPAPTEPTQPGSTPAKPEPTQPTTQAPAPAPKGDNSWLLMVLAALGIVAVVAAVVILKKRGRK